MLLKESGNSLYSYKIHRRYQTSIGVPNLGVKLLNGLYFLSENKSRPSLASSSFPVFSIHSTSRKYFVSVLPLLARF